MDLMKDTSDYLMETVGFHTIVQRLRPRHLPIFITEQYDFYTLRCDDLTVLGVVLRVTSTEVQKSFSPSALQKHQEYFPIQKNHDGFLLIACRLEGFTRKRLIEMKVPFIVPHVQLYWPALGLEFRKRNQKKTIEKISDSLEPGTQAVVIGIMNGLFLPIFQPRDLEKKLSYSLMSMTRAVEQLEKMELGVSHKKGINRLFTPIEKHTLWKRVLSHLKDPVRGIMRFEECNIPEDIKILAGESALAQISDLVEPRTPTYAVGRDQWRRLQDRAIPHLKTEEPGTCAVQIWRYDPALFAKKGVVDVFSLYLSLKDSHDERVAMACIQMIKEYL